MSVITQLRFKLKMESRMERIKAFVRLKPLSKNKNHSKTFSKSPPNQITSIKHNDIFDFGKIQFKSKMEFSIMKKTTNYSNQSSNQTGTALPKELTVFPSFKKCLFSLMDKQAQEKLTQCAELMEMKD